MRLGRRWKRLALVLLMAVGANALAAAAPAHVFATTLGWNATSHSHEASCPPASHCNSSCAVTSHCALTLAALPVNVQQAESASPETQRLTFQFLLPTSDTLGVEAPPPRI